MLQYSRTNNQVYTNWSEGTVISFDETIERALTCIGCHFVYAEAWKTSLWLTRSVVHVDKMPWSKIWSSRYLTAEAEIQVTVCQHFKLSEWVEGCVYLEKMSCSDWLRGIQNFVVKNSFGYRIFEKQIRFEKQAFRNFMQSFTLCGLF